MSPLFWTDRPGLVLNGWLCLCLLRHGGRADGFEALTFLLDEG